MGVVTSQLNQLVALRLSGALPQNVNYAIKSDALLRLLEREFGADWRPAEPLGDAADLPTLVERAQSSVVLIIARGAGESRR